MDMKNRGCRLLLLWALLFMLVLIYTDRDEYTWRYTQADLPMILQTREAAALAQQAADAAYEDEAEQAAQRHARGEWGGYVQYGGAPETRLARDEAPGLNLMWGEYEVTLDYVSSEPLHVSVVSAGRQAFIREGNVGLEAAPHGASVPFFFTLTDSTERVMLACDLPDGAQITAVAVHKRGTGVFSADLAAYAALAGGVLTWLLLLFEDGRPIGRQRRRDALVLVLAAVFASLPALMENIVDGHDLFFHMNRIEGIAGALRSGQFPARIHTSTLLGYGYAAPQFYPEAFLYIPALLRNMGVSLMASVQVFMMLINLATAVVCYESVLRLLASRTTALLASVLYTLSIYRLVSLYAVSTLGEALAMVFFPLLILALYEVLVRDRNRWPLLALSVFCIFMSHMLSTLLAVGFCALAALCCVRRLLREPGRILACILAAGLTVLCSLWFVVPFLQYSATGVNTSVVLESYRYRLTLGALLLGFSSATGDAHSAGRALEGTIGAHPGLAVLLGCALLLLAYYVRGSEKREEERLPAALLAFGTLALLCTTGIFPWEFLCSLVKPFSTIFQQIQFPRRMLSIATPLLSTAAACGYLKNERWRMSGAALAIGLCVVFSGYFMGDFVMQTPILDKEGYVDTRVRQYEYLYLGTEKGLLEPGRVVYGDAQEPVASFERDGAGLTIRLAEGCEGPYVEVPLLYYPGYRATINGEECRVVMGDNNVIRLYGAFSAAGDEVRVWFDEPVSWRIAEGVSLAGVVLLAWLLARRRRAA